MDTKMAEELLLLLPRFLAADGGTTYHVLGDTVRVLATSRDTGGQFCLIDNITPPGGGPPMHLHTREDEAFYVLEGTVEVTVQDTVHTLTPGCYAFGPRGIPHRFQNVGDTPSRMLVFITPGGFEEFFRECAEQIGQNPPDVALLTQLGAAVGMSFV